MRLARLLRELPLVHPALGRWFVERSKNSRWFDPLCSMPPQPGNWKQPCFAVCRAIRISGIVRPSKGFSSKLPTARIWEGVGRNSELRSARTIIKGRPINRFEFSMHDRIAARDPLFLPEVIKELIRLLADTMEPDCLDVAPVEWLSSVEEDSCPAGGWMSYVRDVSLCDFPVGVHVEDIGEKGVLASVTKKVFSDKNANCCAFR